jgi:hypothetical protein
LGNIFIESEPLLSPEAESLVDVGHPDRNASAAASKSDGSFCRTAKQSCDAESSWARADPVFSEVMLPGYVDIDDPHGLLFELSRTESLPQDRVLNGGPALSQELILEVRVVVDDRRQVGVDDARNQLQVYAAHVFYS